MVSGKPVLFALLVLAQPLAAAPRVAFADAVTLLERAGGSTDHQLLGAALDAIRDRGRDGAPAAEAIAKLLPHEARVYTGRDKTLVVRLRAYAMATLADVGVPRAALPALLETLTLVDERMPPAEVGAAARAAGTLGPGGRRFVPHLLDALPLERLNAIEFSLERYEPLFPREEGTTVRLEAIRSLGRLCTAGDADAIAALDALTNDPDPRVVGEAARAVAAIRDRRTR